ncbi:hypothetical protein ACF1DY_01875 [Streptomyces albus]
MPDGIGHQQPTDSPTQRLLTATLTGLDTATAHGDGPDLVNARELLSLHARRIHGTDWDAVDGSVRSALDAIGNPQEPIPPHQLRRRIRIALDEGVAQ